MSIQQRLLQREPLDQWSIREQLCLASAVCRSGDQNWMSVSRALRAAGDPTRPQDWYQQKYCAAQYGALLESAETPKRKKRTSEGAAETPQEAILKRLTADRIAELQSLMQDYKTQYNAIKEEVAEAQSPATSEARLREMLAGVEAARRQREREQQRQAQLLRDREQRRRGDSRRGSLASAPVGALSPPASSPLLTSLLKNTSPSTPGAPTSVTQMLHIPHPSTVPDAVSPSASAPTLSMLLEKGREGVTAAGVSAAPPAPRARTSTDAAVIEQIKSELQAIENNYNLRLGNMSAATPPVLCEQQDKLDIDDIEIKAEDVYAFSELDLQIQPVSAIHKPATLTRSAESSTSGKEIEAAQVVEEEATEQESMQIEEKEIKEEVQEIEPPIEEKLEMVVEKTIEKVEEAETTPLESSVDAIESTPTVEQVETPAEVTETTIDVTEKATEERETPIEETETATVSVEQDRDTETEKEEQKPEINVEEVIEEASAADPEDEEVNVTSLSESNAEQSALQDAPVEDLPSEAEIKTEVETVPEESTEPEMESLEPAAASTPPPADKPHVEEQSGETSDAPASDGGAAADTEQAHTETDDDTPMEVIREEEKLGRKRRDYSRRKTHRPSESRGCSGSESAAESAPASPVAAPRASAPATPDPEKDHRLWKKSVMLVYNRLCAHKYASLFVRPITDDVAPDYSLVVRRPMDLTSIKRNIDCGVIRTTVQFQRDILLMLSNALMYNSSRHRVHHMAQDMHMEASAQLGMLLQAQAHAALADSQPPVRRPHPATKRKRLSSPQAPPSKRPRDSD